jgi:hypothetical protein
MRGIGDVQLLDLARVGLLESNPPRIGGPPVAVESIHLLLGDEFGEAVDEPQVFASGQAPLPAIGQVGHPEVAVPHARHAAAIGREPCCVRRSVRALQLAKVAALGGHNEQSSGERHQHLLPIGGQLVGRDAARPQALPLATRPLLAGQVVVASADQGVRGHQEPLDARSRLEDVEILHEAPRL